MRPTPARRATSSIVRLRRPKAAASASAASRMRSLSASSGGSTLGSSASAMTLAASAATPSGGAAAPRLGRARAAMPPRSISSARHSGRWGRSCAAACGSSGAAARARRRRARRQLEPPWRASTRSPRRSRSTGGSVPVSRQRTGVPNEQPADRREGGLGELRAAAAARAWTSDSSTPWTVSLSSSRSLDHRVEVDAELVVGLRQVALADAEQRAELAPLGVHAARPRAALSGPTKRRWADR